MNAYDKISEAIHEVECGCGEAGQIHHNAAAAILAAIRDMSPAEQAEIIGGEVEWGVRSVSGALLAAGTGEFTRAREVFSGFTFYRRTIGPWVEVQP